jgi:hypothetical protein
LAAGRDCEDAHHALAEEFDLARALTDATTSEPITSCGRSTARISQLERWLRQVEGLRPAA